MTRIAPQAGLADAAAVAGVGAEGGELAVGDGLAGEPGQPEGDPDDIERAQRRGVATRRQHRQREQHGRDRLKLEEDQQPAIGVGAPLAPHLLVAAVLRFAADAGP